MIRATSKDKIIDTSITVFAEKGFSDTSINDIANTANISVGLMYRYFKSKQDLFEQIIDIAVGGIRGITRILNNSESPKDILQTVCHEMVKSLNDENYIKLNQLIMQGLLSREHFAFSKIIAADEEMIDALCDLIRKGQTQGVFEKGDAVAKAHLFISIIQGMTSMKSAFKGKYLPPTADDMTAFIIKK